MRNPTWPLYDRLLDGKLEQTIRGLQAAGLKAPDIRDALRDDYEVAVSVPTVRRWIAALAEPETAA